MKYKLFSVESRKGGVGKTTIALNLGVKLLEMDYKVLLLDCDITGTSISDCSEDSVYWKDAIHVIKKKKDKEVISVNLLDYFKNCYLVGKTENWEKNGDSPFNIEELNYIGSELYDDETLVIDPRVLMDELHSYWVIGMLKEIVNDFANYMPEKNTAIIIDNSPGYVGLGRAVHEWLSDIGPEYARFMLVSSLDEQDIKSTFYSLKEIKRQVEGKIRVKRYYDQLSDTEKTACLDENEEAFLKSDDCYNRFFYKLTGGFEYMSSVKKKYLLSDYVSVIFNKVSEEYIKSDYDYDFNGVLPKEYEELIAFLFTRSEDRTFSQNMIPFDYNIQTQFFRHRLKNQKAGTEKYWVNRFKNMTERMAGHRKNRNLVSSSFRMDKLIQTLKTSMAQKGQGMIANDIKDKWLVGPSLNAFSKQVTTIAFYNKPDNRLILDELDKNSIMLFNKVLLDQFVANNKLVDFEALLDSFFDYLYTLAGAKKSARDIRLLVTISVFCNATRCIWSNDYHDNNFIDFIQQQSKRTVTVSTIKKYMGDFVPVSEKVSLSMEAFMGVFGKCFEEFYKSVCNAILRMYYRIDNFLLLSNVLQKLILSSQYNNIPEKVERLLDAMIVEMSEKRDVGVFDKIINEKIKMDTFESIIGHVLHNQWKL